MKITAQTFDIGNETALPGGAPFFGAADTLGASLVVPGGAWPLSADFVRQGADLLISGKGGESFVVRDYFSAEAPADLHTEGGAVLRADWVERLAGAPAPGQYAQNTVADPGEEVGRIETVLGEATALRVDGTQVTLTAGDPIYKGDVLQTAAEASVGVVFADKTTLSLGAEGRLVIDDFVYDPQAQVGGMDVNVVQGVFTFVSGEIAKLGPDSMTVYTPVATVGIRGTKVAGRAAAEGEENTISLLPNDDGTVGVIAVGNLSGAAPQILTNAGATTVVTSQFQAPPPPFVLSQTQIQQQYGSALQTLSVTQQSVQTRQDAAPDPESQEGDSSESPGAGEGTGEGEEGEAPAGDQEAAAPQEGEAPLSEEEQAARAAADAAARDGETPEGTLEAAIEAAADRALAEGASPEEVAAAEAAAREAYNEALANGESPEAALEAALASVGEAELTAQLGEGAEGAPAGPDGPAGPGGPDGAQAPDIQLSDGARDAGQDAVLGAAETAAESALAEGASEEEAFDAAVRAAMDAAIARSEDPEEVAQIAAEVRENHADAIEAGVDPAQAMALAFNTAGEETRGGFEAAPATGTQTGGEGTIALGGAENDGGDPLGNFLDGGTFLASTIGTQTEISFVPIEPILFTTPIITTTVVEAPPPEEKPNLIPLTADETSFTETITLTSTGGPFDGGGDNTEFVFDQNLYGSGSSAVLVSDQGGSRDRITFANLDGLAVRMGNFDSSLVQVDIFAISSSVSTNTLSSGSGDHQLHVTRDIEDLQGSLADLTTGLVVKNAVDTTNNETAFIVAGSDASNDSLTLDDTNSVGALVFGKGGDDTFTLTSVTTDHILSGGEGSDTVNYNGIAGSVLVSFDTGAAGINHGESTDSFDSIENLHTGGNDDFLQFIGSGSTGGFDTVAGGGGVDRFLFDGGVSSSATFFGDAGDDLFTFKGITGGAVTIGDFNSSGSDQLVFDVNDFLGNNAGDLTSGNLVVDGSPTASNHNFLFNTTTKVLSYDADGNGAGAAVDIAVLNGYTVSESDIKFANILDVSGTGTHALTGITDIIDGSSGDDNITLTGAAASGDIFKGGGGTDTLTLDDSGNTLIILNTETVIGGASVDNLTFASALGNNGSASVTGGAGADTVNLAAGVNRVSFQTVEAINGSAGNNTLTLNNTQSGVSFDFGAGTDTLNLADGTNSVALANIETITSGSAADALTVTTNLTAGEFINMGGSTDSLQLADGANTVQLLNVETVSGGSVDDTLTLTSGTSGLTIDLSTGSDTLNLGTGVNDVTVANTETIVGNSSADTIVVSGSTGANVTGAGGADTITLGGGSDIIRFTASSDSTTSVTDTINNFKAAGTDQIDISAIVNGNSFTFLGASAFSSPGSGNVEARFNDAGNLLQVDEDGNGSVDLQVVLAGVTAAGMAAGDFITV